MVFMNLQSYCNFDLDGYDGINIQVEIKCKKKKKVVV